ncbi:cryptochrome/photolyase family protein [Chromobacterium haemolyticum]|uniref:cryptochrome/photolyase family protein n=1 Tax=Chromobacterium haemolyticum TaxID=394935 RepID=UPI0005BCA994|nr:cryptochrome/photolyase family protein [Chromobacterium haemolyticum]
MTLLRLILGDQLNPNHSWFTAPDPEVVHVMMEIRQETDYVRHHAQKILAIFAAMRDFASQLKALGHRVRYIAIDDGSNRQSLIGNLDALIRHYGATRVEYQAPDEWRLDHQLARWGADLSIPCHMADSEHFYTARGDAAAFFGARRQWRQETLYRHLRRKHGILVDENGEPADGRWNFDAENRQRWSGSPPEPNDPRPEHDHRGLWQTINDAGVNSFGQPQAEALRWPLKRAEAQALLCDFIERTLPHFGAYQDAMSRHARRLFHSQLSFALNVKMLNPREVVDAAIAAWRAGRAPLAAVEGFVRQILGWREYVRGVYWAKMPGYRDNNALSHNLPLPRWFWDGETGMRCLAHAIGQSLEDAYAHHIQRLMVIGNFGLIAGLSPQALHEWYLGVYIDAFEWVELPNTLGMSQFADGGLLGSKPYAGSAAYIGRMSDYCAGCRYQPKLRIGRDACPFNALYWNFFQRHRARLAANRRLSLVYRQLDKLPDAEQAAIAAHAATLQTNLDTL